MYSLGRSIYAGTYLICPKCREPQAILIADIIDADKAFDWRVIKPIDPDAMVGVSVCCSERYVTFDGLFFTEDGPI